MSVYRKIEFENSPKLDFEDPNKRNLVAEVSTKTVKIFGKGNPLKIIAIDCGMKSNIIRMLVDRGAEVKLVPWDYDVYNELPSCDGVFISNGPGDPTVCVKTIDELRKVINAPDHLLKVRQSKIVKIHMNFRYLIIETFLFLLIFLEIF